MTSRDYSDPAHILIIDDNPNIHRDFELVLLEQAPNKDLDADEQRMYGAGGQTGAVKHSYSLEHALSGLEGVDKVQQAVVRGQPFQVAFVDIRMPGIDGVEAIERLWAIDPLVQVVICTAYADYSWDDLARRLGPTDKLLLLKKPFDSIEVTLLASTLAEKWFLARQAGLKLEQMELLVAQRTQKLLELQRLETPKGHSDVPPAGNTEANPSGSELPVVLVVSEAAEASNAIRGALGAAWRVVEAHNKFQGLQQARDAVPDVIVAEVAPPRLDGLDLCRRLRDDDLANHIPVILLNVDGSEATQIKALEAGADDFLVQPFGLPMLKARIESLLRSRRRLQEHFSQESAFQPRDIALNQVDAKFLRRAVETVEKYLSDFEFDVEGLAQGMAISRRQLFRKLKAVTGRTPNAFIRALRLKRAAQLLEQSQMTITEITYAVGFSDLKHFRTVFREQYGRLPGEYLKQISHPHLNSAERGADGTSADHS